jgi:transcriptional activator HAC1
MSTPRIKFENSPTESQADSFVSTPGTQWPSLFPTNESVNECMTPQSYDEDSMFGGSIGGSISGTPAPEKKPIKKRKSWGQQLPEPKTNLPPRKRAKTEDEKEQRRVERVLRNRRAAQSSRERKRQEVEALENEKMAIERRNHDLEMRLAEMEAKNMMLQTELEKLTGNMTVFRGSSTTASPRQSPRPVTFSKDLFAREANERSPMSAQVSPLDTQPTRTVNPASLSPEIRPVAESSNASSSDMTQHPAAMLCDLQCQSE